MRLKGFYLGRPQQVAAVLLLLMFGECCWMIARHPLDANDYRYARWRARDVGSSLVDCRLLYYLRKL